MDDRKDVSVGRHGGGRLIARASARPEYEEVVREALGRSVRLTAEVDRAFLRRFLLERGVPPDEADAVAEAASLDDDTYAVP